jgi:hypothetical protein
MCVQGRLPFGSKSPFIRRATQRASVSDRFHQHTERRITRSSLLQFHHPWQTIKGGADQINLAPLPILSTSLQRHLMRLNEVAYSGSMIPLASP